MSRLIDANSIMRKIADMLKESGNPYLAEKAIALIDLEPTVVDNNGWVSVKERLPEDNGGKQYIITDECGNVHAELFYGYADENDNKPCFYEWDSEYWQCFRPNVVAWMEYPEPYRPERSDNHDGE